MLIINYKKYIYIIVIILYFLEKFIEKYILLKNFFNFYKKYFQSTVFNT